MRWVDRKLYCSCIASPVDKIDGSLNDHGYRVALPCPHIQPYFFMRSELDWRWCLAIESLILS